MDKYHFLSSSQVRLIVCKEQHNSKWWPHFSLNFQEPEGAPWAEYQPAYACAHLSEPAAHGMVFPAEQANIWLVADACTRKYGYSTHGISFVQNVYRERREISRKRWARSQVISLSLGTTVCLWSVLASALQPCPGLIASFFGQWEQGACQGGGWSLGVEDPKEEQSEGKFEVGSSHHIPERTN